VKSNSTAPGAGYAPSSCDRLAERVGELCAAAESGGAPELAVGDALVVAFPAPDTIEITISRAASPSVFEISWHLLAALVAELLRDRTPAFDARGATGVGDALRFVVIDGDAVRLDERSAGADDDGARQEALF